VKKTDLTYLLSMTDENNELILEIIEIFVLQVEEIWKEMQLLYDKGDFTSLGMLAHKAKSSVAIMGMKEMEGKLKKLELFCQEKINSELYQDIILEFKNESLQAIDELLLFKENRLKQKK
jgi:HPt (histidine-containing phosphotransfer) domain-containing protein